MFNYCSSKKKDRNFYEPSNSEQKKFFGGRGTIGVFGSYIPNFHTLSSFFAIRAFSVILNLQNRSYSKKITPPPPQKKRPFWGGGVILNVVFAGFDAA